jgi:hypothetical protein
MLRLHSALLVVAVAVLLLGSLPTIAAKSRSHTSISPSSQNGEVNSSVAAQPVENCGGYSDRPHKSSHVPGTVNAQGRTVCPSKYPTIYVFSELYKEGKFVDRTQQYANNKDLNIATTNVNANCPKKAKHYRIQSYHYVVFPDFDYGSSNTSNSADVACPK